MSLVENHGNRGSTKEFSERESEKLLKERKRKISFEFRTFSKKRRKACAVRKGSKDNIFKSFRNLIMKFSFQNVCR